MSAFTKDLVWRVARTAIVAAIGALVPVLTDHASLVWFAAPIAAALSLIVGWLQAAPTLGAAWGIVEKGGWTLAQVVLAAIPTATLGWSPLLVPLFAGLIAVAKGFVAKHIGDPRTAATLPRYRLAA